MATTNYLTNYPMLSSYSVQDLQKTYAYLTDAIAKYQTLESNVWNQQNQLQNPNFSTNQQQFLQQQKIVNLQAERDAVMQQLLKEYQQNTQYYDAALKMKTDSQYINSLQSNLYNVNANKLGAINSDIMTYSRVASMNTEQYRSVLNLNQYMKVSIIFECCLIIILIIALKGWFPPFVTTILILIFLFLWTIVLMARMYINRRSYRMLSIEKDFGVPDGETEPTETSCSCQTTCPAEELFMS